MIVIIFGYFTYEKSNEVKTLLERNQNQFVLHYNLQKEYMSDIAQNTFFSIINKSNITNCIKNSLKGNDADKTFYKKKLFKEFNPDFQRLKELGFTQVQFYLPDNRLLLKMNNKDTFNNDMSTVRLSLSTLNKTLKPVSSFEVGKQSFGFRYFFPIFDDNLIHIGNVELFNSSSSFKIKYEKSFNVDINFIVDKDIVNNKMSSDGYSQLRQSSENDFYMINKKEPDFVKSDFKHPFYTKNEKVKIQEQMLLGVAFSMYKNIQNNNYVVITFIPIKNSIGITNSAYLVIYKSSNYLNHIFTDYFNIMMFLLIITLILLIIFIKAYKNHKIKKQNELLIIQQSKMASIGEMLENIAHQWRQPLSLISTIASGMLMEKEYGILKDEKIEPNLQEIINSTQYLSQTIEDFRKILKRDHKKEKFNIETTIDNVLKLFGKSLKNKNIMVIKHIENIEVISYQNELQQVIINIVKNAKDAIEIYNNKIKNHKDNIIMITVKELNENEILIKIQDNAGGIKDDIIDKIFEPYFTTKHQSNGTGIGLYMSYNIIVNILHSKIFVSNENFSYNFNNYFGASFNIILHKEEMKDEE